MRNYFFKKTQTNTKIKPNQKQQQNVDFLKIIKVPKIALLS